MTEAPAGVTLPTQQATSEDKLAYRLITGPDNRAFCERISDALAEGYVLHRSPTAAFNGRDVIVAQAVILPLAVATADAAVATAVDQLDSDENLDAEAFEGHA